MHSGFPVGRPPVDRFRPKPVYRFRPKPVTLREGGTRGNLLDRRSRPDDPVQPPEPEENPPDERPGAAAVEQGGDNGGSGSVIGFLPGHFPCSTWHGSRCREAKMLTFRARGRRRRGPLRVPPVGYVRLTLGRPYTIALAA